MVAALNSDVRPRLSSRSQFPGNPFDLSSPQNTCRGAFEITLGTATGLDTRVLPISGNALFTKISFLAAHSEPLACRVIACNRILAENYESWSHRYAPCGTANRRLRAEIMTSPVTWGSVTSINCTVTLTGSSSMNRSSLNLSEYMEFVLNQDSSCALSSFGFLPPCNQTNGLIKISTHKKVFIFIF